MKINKSTVFQILILVGIGIVIGLLINTPVKNTEISEVSQPLEKEKMKTVHIPSSSINEQIENINQLLASEIEARDELQNKLAMLQTQFDSFLSSSGTDTPKTQQRVISTQQSSLAVMQDRTWFNETALLEAGMDASEAHRLREMYEKNEMDRLYLRDKAIREGWLGKPKYRKEMEALNNQIDGLREDLDEEKYDAYLFASGKSNRVVVNSALSSSPAAKAGLGPGDVILKYNNKRVFTAGDLREMTTQGETGSMVSVEVIRNGKLITVYLPVGPLGIRMNSRSVAPNSQ